jgi:AcrR family transcriptional regulator
MVDTELVIACGESSINLIVIDMKSANADMPRKIGRPLSFDRDVVLRKAMLTFWRYGYETTSISDLTAAMGVTAPSIYATFGDKRRLFLEAVNLYTGDPSAMDEWIHATPTAQDAARSLLVASAERFTGETTPPGCLLASATASGSAACAAVMAAVSQVRLRIETALRQRIERDVTSGFLPEATSPDAMAGMVMAVIQGMSVLARDGAGRQKLLAITEQTLRGWPR